MTTLEEWYRQNCQRVESMGVNLLLPSAHPVHYLDGEYRKYMFRFIDRGNETPDIEIVDSFSGEAVRHDFNKLTNTIYDDAIEFIVALPD